VAAVGSYQSEIVAVGGAALVVLTSTIASGQTVSSAVDILGRKIAGIDMGAAFTGTALSIKNAADETNYRPVHDTSGNAISWTVAGDRFLKFDPPLHGYEKIKLVSGSAEAADRTLSVVLVP
jgi:hypothetical protein